MQINIENINVNFNRISVSEFWSKSVKKEYRMHKIHGYPAKFPSLVVSKAIEHAIENNINIETVSDVFCGCGTAALESKRHNLNFWGCDINPVATLITKVKRENYTISYLDKLYTKIMNTYNEIKGTKIDQYYLNDDRLNYWFFSKERDELFYILKSININTSEKSKYRLFFHCTFSNILKASSKWLSKSIKPQIDPDKEPAKPLNAFRKQFELMKGAVIEWNQICPNSNATSTIINANFLNISRDKPFIDLLITSPPYVTSYEYADLHQLSSLWLRYTDDYRKLRKGSIGSTTEIKFSKKEVNKLNHIGKKIYKELELKDKSKARSVARYFIDMNNVAVKAYSLVKPGGMSLFVIGNTSYKGVLVDNAKYLTQCLLDSGYKSVQVHKRKLGPKFLTPYRDAKGKFTNKRTRKQVYNYEFVVVALKKS